MKGQCRKKPRRVARSNVGDEDDNDDDMNDNEQLLRWHYNHVNS